MTTAAEHRLQELSSWKERQFQDWVIARARELGWRKIYHTYDSRRSVPGFPDLVLVNVTAGRIMFRELKTMTGRVSPEQREWINDLLAVGMDVGIWRPDDVANGLIIEQLGERNA